MHHSLAAAVSLSVVALSFVLGMSTNAQAQKGSKPPPPPPPPSYGLYLLENTLGGTWSRLSEINNLGDVIGTAEDAAGRGHPIVSTPEMRAAGFDMASIQDLLVAGGHTVLEPRQGWFSVGVGRINDSRTMIGIGTYYEEGINLGRRFIRLHLAMDAGNPSITAVDDLGMSSSGMWVYDLNNQGDILASVSLAESSALILHTAELGWTVVDVPFGSAVRMSNRDDLASVFLVTYADGAKRFTYNIPTDTITNVVTLKGTYKQDPVASADNVNDLGNVCGWMKVAREDEFAMFYVDGVTKNLGTLTSAHSWNDSWANAVNNSNVVVGTSMMGTAPNNTGLHYIHSVGATYDMASTLSGADKTAYESLVPRGLADINDDGVICGPGTDIAINDSYRRAFLLIPTGQ